MGLFPRMGSNPVLISRLGGIAAMGGYQVMDYHIYVGLALMMALDIGTGYAGAVVSGSVSSTKMRNGLFHKLGFICAIVLAAILENMCGYLDLGFELTFLQPAVAAYIVLTEVSSILENIVILNPSLGDTTFLAIFKNRSDDGE